MEKDQAIESLRALAIILVVGLHIVNDGPLDSVDSLYEYIAYTFQNIRIPLFTVISGYLYGYRPAKSGVYKSFLLGKSRRILLPLFVVVSLEVIAKTVLPGVNNPLAWSDLFLYLVLPYEHFWFLQAIFLVFVLIGFLDAMNLINTYFKWCCLFALSLVWYWAYPLTGLDLPFFSFGTVGYLLPYFLLGYGLSKYPCDLLAKPMLLMWVALFCVFFFVQQILWFYGIPEWAGKRTVIGLVVSVSGCVVLFRFRRPVAGLSFVGSYAFTIYLYQGFGTAIGRRLGNIVADVSPHLYFFVVLGSAIFIGIIIETFISRIPRVRTILLGIK